MSQARGGVDLVGHNIIQLTGGEPGPLPPIDNIIVRAPTPEHRWVEVATTKIGEWRAELRSTYIRWSLAINGLEVAADKYADTSWSARNQFVVRGLGGGGIEALTVWDGKAASKTHRDTMSMLAAFGVIDLYAGLEDVVFALYRIFLNAHPEPLLEGDQYRDLRKLRKASESDHALKAEWDASWAERLDKWQRKRMYDGLADVFGAFCRQAGLKAPSTYKHTTVETWCEVIGAVAVLRNALVHGAKTVPQVLAGFCKKPYCLTFDFVEGEPLAVHLGHLMGVQLFCEQILSAVNLSLTDLVFGPAKSQ